MAKPVVGTYEAAKLVVLTGLVAVAAYLLVGEETRGALDFTVS